LSTTIKIKRRVTGAAGPPSSLASGEMAFNEIDKTLYYGTGDSGGIATNIKAIGGANVAGSLSFETDHTIYFYVTLEPDNTRWLSFDNGYYLNFQPGNSTFTLHFNNNPAGALEVLTSNTYKVGGGPWLALSDCRIKDVHERYVGGLAQIEQLQPVVYSYKGNDASPGGVSPHAAAASSGKEFIGLVAQECEELFPEMVTRRTGFIDGAAVSDLRELDTGPLLYAMLNAIKELSRRLAVAEAKLERAS